MAGEPTEEHLDAAAGAIGRGELVVYPTETVYGLGADALEPDAVERVFEAKRRSRDDPLSLAVPDVGAAMELVRVDERVRAFMDAFLPGPVTVVCEKAPIVPEVLTGGRDRVGVRVPDHPVALALLDLAAPITATSANVSGRGSARRVDELDEEIVEVAAVIVDGGETPGGGSTVVDPERGGIHRRGPLADEIEAWLEGH
jgi:L-threonylcarbamoyladenylate synthase